MGNSGKENYPVLWLKKVHVCEKIVSTNISIRHEILHILAPVTEKFYLEKQVIFFLNFFNHQVLALIINYQNKPAQENTVLITSKMPTYLIAFDPYPGPLGACMPNLS